MGRRIPTEVLVRAITECDGVVTKAANLIGCHYSVFHRREKEKTPDGDQYRDALSMATMGLVDIAVSGLKDLIDDGNLQAILFVLRCHGWSRGWVERIESQKVILNLNITPEQLAGMTDEQFSDFYNEQLRGAPGPIIDVDPGEGETPKKEGGGTYIGPPGVNGDGKNNNGEVLPP